MDISPPDGGTAAAYDVVAADYARLLPDDGFEAPLDRAMISDFAERVRGTRSRRVIDAGCGAGRMAPALIRSGLEYVGVDNSEGMIDAARILNPARDFRVGDLTALPGTDASAGGVLAWYSIIHTPPDALPDVFAEFRRVLHEGGFVLLGVQVGDGERRLHRAYGHDVDLVAHLHDPSRLQQLLRDAGFTPAATLTRAARPFERHDQAMILASTSRSGQARP